ncbi:MAG: signal peptidase I [Candidatus Hydrogenedentes bacterium]|nr:signal peptidase I [Candidatus Hydrogenedentota bacterium]
MDPEVKEAGAAREKVVTPRQEIKREVLELVKMVALFLVLFWGIKSFVVEGYEVQGPSMTTTLDDRERILVFKLTHQLSQLSLLHGLTAIQPGDIVVFDSDEHNKRYIKRVIAKGPPSEKGNLVDARQKDELSSDEEQIHFEYRDGATYVDYQPLEEEYLPPQERRSRDHIVKDLASGEYFVMGDHRSVSKDSRSFGPIHEQQIIGKAVLRFWPLSKFGFL